MLALGLTVVMNLTVCVMMGQCPVDGIASTIIWSTFWSHLSPCRFGIKEELGFWIYEPCMDFALYKLSQTMQPDWLACLSTTRIHLIDSSSPSHSAKAYHWLFLTWFSIFTESQESGVSLHCVDVFTMYADWSEFRANSREHIHLQGLEAEWRRLL